MEAKIVGAEETVELKPDGTLQRISVIRYTLNGLGPFEFRCPVEEETPQKLAEHMKRKAQMLTPPKGV